MIFFFFFHLLSLLLFSYFIIFIIIHPLSQGMVPANLSFPHPLFKAPLFGWSTPFIFLPSFFSFLPSFLSFIHPSFFYVFIDQRMIKRVIKPHVWEQVLFIHVLPPKTALFSLVVLEVSLSPFFLPLSLSLSLFSSSPPLLPLSLHFPLFTTEHGQLGQGSNHSHPRPNPIKPFSRSGFVDDSKYFGLGDVIGISCGFWYTILITEHTEFENCDEVCFCLFFGDMMVS